MFNSVLVVEDRLEHFAFLEQALEQHNAEMRLESVQTVADAKQKVHADFDLYILDLELPDGEGIELIPDIRKTNPDAKIMVNTVFEEDEMFFKAMRLGIDGYLLKTASQGSLLGS
ncbi:MAG: response regulator transcription factor, partial [Hydrogenovibrio sp.]|nr:response regulator transcription factor [Hydrogenovibrio sp.]